MHDSIITKCSDIATEIIEKSPEIYSCYHVFGKDLYYPYMVVPILLQVHYLV